MKQFLLKLMSLLLLLTTAAYAQDRTITGTVTSAEDNQPMPSVTVLIKGTNTATQTDIDGKYSIKANAGSTLVFSFVGYTAREVKLGSSATINIQLVTDSKQLGEVVVTALGIKREKKALGYSMQELKGDALTESRDPNMVNALSGKVAGLQIKQNGTGPTGSTRIVLRGNNSLGSNNQPLVVVDGVPIDNYSGNTADFWGNKSIDKGSGINDVASDDVESISVLKGPAAAALYGSRAGNGVIMITTKKGKKGFSASLSSSLTVDNPMQTPDFQNVYGQGTLGVFNANATGSWGPKMEGQQVTDYTGKSVPFSAGNNNLNDFIEKGNTWTNNFEMSTGNDNTTFRASLMRVDNKGIVPNSGFNKTSFTLRGTGKLNEKFSTDAKISYSNQKTENRIKVAGDPDNIFRNYLLMPRSVHFSDLRSTDGYAFPAGAQMDGVNVTGKPLSWTSNYAGLVRNPYWAAYNNTNNDRRNRFMGFLSFKYDLNSWLNVQVRQGMDMYNAQYNMRQATNTPYWETSGTYIVNDEKFYESNTDFLVSLNKNISPALGFVATAGGNTMYQRSNLMVGDANGLFIPNFFKLNNGLNQRVADTEARKRINSLYATASLSYNNYLYLDLSARNDWTSTLSPDNRSYFYPSVGASWVISEMLERKGSNLGPFSYAKVRASWAQVGNDALPYQLLNYMDIAVDRTTDPNGNIIPVINANASNTKALYDLKNETIESYEFGVELKALQNRVGLDISYYNKDSKNQILRVQSSGADGYEYEYMNAGLVNNKGIEAVLFANPVKSGKFNWDVSLNFAKNTNKIVELTDKSKVQFLNDNSTGGFLQIVAKEGGAYGDLYGRAYIRDAQNNIVVDETGLPTFTTEFVKLGNFNPQWMAGLNNNFNFGDVSLGFQVDMRYGGSVYMGSIRSGMTAGTLAGTLEGRDKMLVDGVTSTGAKNTVETTSQNYWNRLDGGAEPWIYDATNVRLREVTLGYRFPKGLMSKSPFASAKLSLVGRNLFMIYSKTKGFDPESGYSNGNAQGIEFGSMPTLRSLGFNLNVTF
ncbi:SusC/RagA family TonB-linked outer membrane protein [Solitalea canadensis]|uniref:TonB-linked outer membrane protein, SusC/RagA family n=1 Tax=Solitalea canadensis (strain ATCC 29591 / DSM 3403 / JCM 21819 / LMG 8368 / NBRC 15130 / NCIMB 12057 / USAM 9D) TaxID=929556 RepID=H8KLY4_SOLCM|nr:SusC/RagA family TonB-linked outer membrane protein [Solitalea canadensis]AFD08712.1 TonB-linked outer membrane protein, SusC/RagA family [Solitalea canadensis DSM 3403]